MRKMFRVRNVILAFLMLPIVLFAGAAGVFAYRTNSCSPGDHVLQSEADAIATAKMKIVYNPHFSSSSFGNSADFVDSLDRTENCCCASRSRTVLGVIVWQVFLFARSPVGRSALVELSNCGDIFLGDSFIYGNN